MRVRDALQEFYFHNRQHSVDTQRWYQNRLNNFCQWCESKGYKLEQLTAKIIAAYIDEVAAQPHHRTGQPLSSYTIHSHARCVRRFCNWLSTQEEFEDIVSPKVGRKIPMPKIKQVTIETFTLDEIKRLFAACEDETTWPWIAARNKAILSVLLDTGIRASELCGLTLEHCYLDPHDPHIKVMGKGSKERELSLGNKSRAALQAYLQVRIQSSSKYVFLGLKHEPLNRNSLEQLLLRLARRAGVNFCHAHKFRHTFAVLYLMQKCGDLHSLSTLLGHTEISTTEIYLRTVRSLQARQLSKSVFDLC